MFCFCFPHFVDVSKSSFSAFHCNFVFRCGRWLPNCSAHTPPLHTTNARHLLTTSSPPSLHIMYQPPKERPSPSGSTSSGDHSPLDEPIVCNDTIRPRRIGPQNIVCRVLARERGIGRVGTNVHNIREFYKNVTPNLTVINVEKPAGFLRKFSPDGKYLIAFTFDQTSLEIYRFRGVAAAAHLINGWPNDIVPNWISGHAYNIRSKIFECLFKVGKYTGTLNLVL